MYYFFSSLPFVQSIHLSPLLLSLLVLLLPSLLLLTLILGAALIIFLIFKGPKFFSFILSQFGKGKVEEKAYLELTFPSNTTKSAYATDQLYKLLHTKAANSRSMFEFLTRAKKTYSLEIASSRDFGIRYLMVVPKKEADSIHNALLSFLPGLKVKEVDDYLDEFSYLFLTKKEREQKELEDSAKKKSKKMGSEQDFSMVGVVEFALSSDFTLPLQDQKVLDEHDPISFLTGNMTNLLAGELVSFQMIASPVMNSTHGKEARWVTNVQGYIGQGKPIIPLLRPTPFQQVTSLLPIKVFIIFPLKVVWGGAKIFFLFLISLPSAISDTSGKSVPILMPPKIEISPTLNTYEREMHQIVKDKLSQHLFETSLRVLLVVRDADEMQTRVDGLRASIGPFTSTHQSIISKKSSFKKGLINFKQRSLSSGVFNKNPILSSSEVTDLYHFPYTDLTKTAGFIKSKSRDLPAPVSMKRSGTKLDIIVGKNEYGRETVPIGMTLDQRERHTYVIGKTGMGKTEMLKNMIYQDMKNGKGLAVLDPHGDLFRELLRIIPKNRRKDVIVFNPADKEWPVGLNILSSGISFSDIEEGRDKIVSTTLAVFQKVTDEKYWGPRLEHILRNTTQTSLFTPAPSFWIVQKLLTSTKDYQKQVANTLKDPILKQFWEGEFALFGKMQQSDVISPITNKIGKFITSIMSRNILLQPKSTFNIQQIMDEGKILLVNLSKGELGEDQSHFFGSLIISLIQLAAYERIHIPESKRRNFFLYVDEFQNFATHIFEELSSEGRKWHVPLIPSHQNIAQIKDPNLLKIVAGNADTFIAMKAGPDDEKFILPFMEPEVEKGGIVNLAPYRFYMKVTNRESEDAFSGETELLEVKGSDKVAEEVIEYSRKHYATPRKEVETYLEKLFAGKDTSPKVKTVKPKPQKTKKRVNKYRKKTW